VTHHSPAHVADQLDAAGCEVRAMHDRLGTLLPDVEPGRRWYSCQDVYPSDEVRAYLTAVLLGCVNVCMHVHRGGPRPAIARLLLGRIDCELCSRTIYRPPSEDDDACDICGRHGVTVFSPFCVRMGPTIIGGDCCSDCAGMLGLRVSELVS